MEDDSVAEKKMYSGNGDKDPELLEREIDEARADVRATLEALEEKLSPGELLDHLMNLARRHGGGVVDSLGVAARENPLATLLASVGLAWLFSAARPAADTARADAPAGAALPAVESSAEPTGVGGRLNRLVYEQPLVVGAIGVALGAMLSVAVGARNRGSETARLLERGEAELASTEAELAEAELASTDAPRASATPAEERPPQPFSF